VPERRERGSWSSGLGSQLVKGHTAPPITDVIGKIPYRLALAGGWIDQPFVSKLDPNPPGSMVVVGIEPTSFFMERSGLATGTRKIAIQRWGNALPDRPAVELTRELYEAENKGKPEPSGSQDMIGLIYPGINRLDYDYTVNGGVYPAHIESLNELRISRWLEKVIHLLPVAPRPEGYNPLGIKRLDPQWVRRLGQSGTDCFEAIRRMDLKALGASMNECMEAWETLLPHTVQHPRVTTDLKGLLQVYQSRYSGAMYSGCGGGYLFIASDEPVPGTLQVTIRGAK
jgi:hypothetical protein